MNEYTENGFIDLTLPAMSVTLYRDPPPMEQYPLPEGYRMEFYRDGDEAKWVDLHMQVKQFDAPEKAAHCFENEFPGKEERMRRMLFVYAPDGSCAGTATAWFNPDGTGRVHWVAVSPAHRGRGIAKALVSRVVRLLDELHGGRIILASLTRNHIAIAMYEKMGFIPDITASQGGEEAWRIIREANRELKK